MTTLNEQMELATNPANVCIYNANEHCFNGTQEPKVSSA